MIPDYQKFMWPVLKAIADKKEHSLNEVRDFIAKELNISAKERKKLIPSGKQSVFNNRVSWAVFYLKKAELVESPKRGFLKLTAQGARVVKQQPEEMNIQYLSRFKSFRSFINNSENTESDHQMNQTSTTPEEMLSENYKLVRKQLAEEVLEQVMKCSPNAFEQLVIDLLLAMGYGGSQQDAGQVVGGTGDGGIDGVIKEDRLGLRQIYIQAKRWEKPVGSPEINRFCGALSTKNADRGVFITTSSFTSSAIQAAERSSYHIVLIDGEKLAELMIDYNVGVVEAKRFVIKRIDTDYFEQFT
ncbi:restriction endonuclease [Thermoflavimicrobium dichotomicum]|uniref:Restriction system protein n=1 Tax=Thermoflavimicrobium dichotomicum TaxID=46223 RepID=A0A1I3RD76_9BACL|nr:restriction endonuclease [Thermoflavimicrobium dichotomicum]SFJ43311.1 restriction system protein [Thermoflavimicrobium dichotomicum]